MHNTEDQVEKWPFNGIANTLIVEIGSQSSFLDINKCTTSANDVTGNLAWVKISHKGVSLYPIVIQ